MSWQLKRETNETISFKLLGFESSNLTGSLPGSYGKSPHFMLDAVFIFWLLIFLIF